MPSMSTSTSMSMSMSMLVLPSDEKPTYKPES